MRTFIGAIASALALVSSQPVLAQETAEEPVEAGFGVNQIFAKIGEMFAAEPLTVEQEVRLPAAQQAVAKVIPDGIYAKMMQDMMGGMLQPIFAEFGGGGMPAGELASTLGVGEESLADLDEEQRKAITEILDPAYEDRTRIGITVMTDGMGELFSALEPSIRDGLSRAYAVRFTDAQLADINGFFATPTGTAYAAESMLVFTDKQAMSGMMKGIPLILEALPALMGKVKEATRSLPEKRSFDTMSADQRASIAGLIGMTVDQLQAQMAAAADMQSSEIDWSDERADEDADYGAEDGGESMDDISD